MSTSPARDQSNPSQEASRLFTRAIEVMALLRSEQGCPWDRAQTPESLKRCLLEEAYETLNAVDAEEPSELCSELGDLLMQILFYAQLASEAKQFDMRDVLQTLLDKLVERHPHVFAEASAETPAQVLRQWEKIKRQSRAKNGLTSILDDIPETLPALMKAAKIQKRVAQVGFDWDSPEGAFNKLEEELKEFRTAYSQENHQRRCEEMGDLFFALVNVARLTGVDSEEALRSTIKKFSQRFLQIEQTAAEQNRPLQSLSLAEMDAIWEETKR